MDTRTIGVLGGGQLARMMGEAAHRLGIKMTALDPLGNESPAGQVTGSSMKGSFQSEELIKELANTCDVLTMDIEHVNTDILIKLESNGIEIHPSPLTVKTIQDKYEQKKYLRSKGIAVADFVEVNKASDVVAAAAQFGYPLVLKSRFMAYDGRGNRLIEKESDIDGAFQALGGKLLYAERFADFTKELAVMVVRGSNEVRSYPVAESVQENHICHTVLAPAVISPASYALAKELSERAVDAFSGRGIYGVELFLLKDGAVLVNEIAPRPHNTGHYTMEACETDQFENHIRAVLGLPLGSCELRVGTALMLNILGDSTADPEISLAPLKNALSIPGAGVHWYGKKELRAGRKMAHLTVTASSLSELSARCAKLGVDLPFADKAVPVVGIIMGSDSDLPTMKDAAEVLDKFQVPYEITIVSAHRTPTRMYEYARSASSRGVRVIIAGAGGAAHLPGMVAALTPLPVIGVPVKTSTLNGQDSLLSIVQMPKGVPVATVAIGNAANAGLLAVRILGSSLKGYEKKMEEFMATQEEEVLKKASLLEEVGYQCYGR